MIDAHDWIDRAETFLFVPGNRPDRFEKALGCGADVVIVDLEDSVPAALKAEARSIVENALPSQAQVIVRINAVGTEWFERDLALAQHPKIFGLVLPKSEPGAELDHVASCIPTVALVESAKGVRGIEAIAAVPGVRRLAMGAIDLALGLDVTAADSVFDPIRLGMTVCSRAAGKAAPIEGVTLNFREPEHAFRDMRHARSLGFAAKLCIHPAQVMAVQRALDPSDAELAQAQRVIDADRRSGGAAVALDGQMVDRPVVERAYRLIARQSRSVG